ncbi:restriction endonuclease subunit S [Streptomyces sp. NPDC005283]|uniref:restriction endonuclease subunit S n=1 Tax=Streptomyces sp. NPDC005283 TaxID=3156871 RepID=UPI0034565DCF
MKLKYCLADTDSGAWGDDPEDGCGVPVLRSTEIDLDGNLDFKDPANRTLTEREISRTRLARGDLLVVRSSGSDAHLGKTGYVGDESAGASFSNFLQRLRLAPTHNSRFAWYFMNSTYAKQQIRKLSSTTTGLQNLSAALIGELEIPSPPLEEQRPIADFLDAETARIDQLTLKRRQMRSLLTLKRERVIESTLGLERAQTTDGLVPLKYLVADVTVGIVITPAKWYVEAGGTPALRGLNVKPGFISTSDLVQISAEGHAENRKSRLNTGDVVVVRTGQAGAAAVVPAEMDGANCIDLIVVRPGRKLSPRYLQYVLNSDYASARVKEHSVGSIQAHFNVGAMKQIPIPSIPRTEQEEIVRLLDIRVGALDLLHRKLDHQEQLLTERRQALITAAVTGQFDVTTASGRNVTDGVSA